MKTSAEKAHREPQESFAALAAAVHPAWHQAIIRLANASERIAGGLEAFNGHRTMDGGLARHARQLVTELIDLLDSLEEDPDWEPTAGGSCTDECEDSGDLEPSLGSQDRNIDQSGWSSFGGGEADLELEEGNAEPSLGWTEGEATRGRYAGCTPGTVDFEEQCDDEGVTL